MRTVHIDSQIKAYEYDIVIGRGSLNELPSLLAKRFNPDSYIVVTDNNVDEIIGEKVVALLETLGKPRITKIVFDAGEEFKNPNTFLNLTEALSDVSASPASIIIGLGGGVVSDIAGFLAATYMRGIKHVQIPTSLVAQVEASLGGKVGIDTEAGKNILGAYWHPSLVVVDTELLSTLPEDELQSGMAEVIKCAALEGEERFGFFEELASLENFEDALEKVLSDTETYITPAIRFKIELSKMDPYEEGRARILNFGHTMGHALLRTVDPDTYTYGQALAWGMLTVTKLSENLDLSIPGTANRLEYTLRGFGLEIPRPEFERDLFIDSLNRDKKSEFGKVRYVLLEKIGKSGVVEMDLKDMAEELGLLDE